MALPTDDEILTALHALRDAQDTRVAAEDAAKEAQIAVVEAEAAYRDAYAAFQQLVHGGPT